MRMIAKLLMVTKLGFTFSVSEMHEPGYYWKMHNSTVKVLKIGYGGPILSSDCLRVKGTRRLVLLRNNEILVSASMYIVYSPYTLHAFKLQFDGLRENTQNINFGIEICRQHCKNLPLS